MRFVFILTIFLWSSFSYAYAKNAQDFIESISDNTLRIVSSEDLAANEKEQQLYILFNEAVDTKWIAKFVAGRYWREANSNQQLEYTGLYSKFLSNNYVPRFKEYTNQSILIKDYIVEDKKAEEYLVQTEITSNDNQSYRVDYKVRYIDGSFKIFDIIAEGISLISTQRSDFSSILSRKGMGHLIKILKSRLENPPA